MPLYLNSSKASKFKLFSGGASVVLGAGSYPTGDITPFQMAMLRANLAPGTLIAGVDTKVGTQIPTASLAPLASLPTSNAGSPPVWYWDTYKTIMVAAGATLDGVDCRGVVVNINGSNATVKNCLFDNVTAPFTIEVGAGSLTGITVKDNTFIGIHGVSAVGDYIRCAEAVVTITGNAFIDSAADCISISAGTVSGNYFSGTGYNPDGHGDCIWVPYTVGPVRITNNYINLTPNGGAGNNTIRITNELGNTNDVIASGNINLGATYTVSTISSTANTFTNVYFTDNLIGFGAFGIKYPGSDVDAVWSGNKTIDFTNKALSDDAWTAYSATLVTDHLIVATANGNDLTAPSTGTVTMYGAGYTCYLSADPNGSNTVTIIGGYKYQYTANGNNATCIYKYLSPSDSIPLSSDTINNFKVARDKFDFSLINANYARTPVQPLTFIGTAAFSGTGGEVRYYYPGDGDTHIQVRMKGSNQVDMLIRVGGVHTLTSANFIL